MACEQPTPFLKPVQFNFILGLTQIKNKTSIVVTVEGLGMVSY